jgi:DNA-directed RNA polymerase specialized sigma24 family protein
MKKDRELTAEQLNQLLDWLDMDRDAAANKYALIQLRLVRFFAVRRCVDAENLADRCINVVAAKNLEELGPREGDRTLYFLGVARYVYLEQDREDRRPPPLPPPQPDPEPEPDLDMCLDHCLDELGPDERSLVLDYEEGEKQTRIQNRRRLANELGITINALRIKVYRLHQQLEKCIKQCLAELPAH